MGLLWHAGAGSRSLFEPGGTPMHAESFADQLRRYRREAGLTQEELAEKAGLSVRGISDLERGLKRRPHPETVRLLALALDLSPANLAALRAAATSSPEPQSASSPTPPAKLVLAPVPEPLTSLVDRQDEVRDVSALVQPGSGVRLVTLIGPGGVGKTRLATQVALDVRDGFTDGVAFVALAGLTDPELVLPAIAKALGIRELPDRGLVEVLSRQLQDRQLLLVMDNFEHLLTAALAVAEVLAVCRELIVLTTSRAPLRIDGEQEYPVRPLGLPEPARDVGADELMKSPAVQLFVRQARSGHPQFGVTDINARAIGAICASVDGLPLALELAAVRMKMLSPDDLEALLGNRLGMLTGGRQDLPTRHRTMRATIAWSHDLLTVEEQVAFRRFAAFVDGATLESATAVIAEGDQLNALDLLAALADQSLVRRFENAHGQPRFTMLETIREFAADQLAASGEESTVRDGHAAHFLDVAERGEDGLTGPDQAAWMVRLETDYGNLRAALDWSIRRQDAASSQRFGSALWHFWSASGRIKEARDWLDRGLALAPDDRSAIRAQALLRRGNIAVDLAEYPAARRLYEESLSIYRELGDDLNGCRALNGLGLVYLSQGEYVAARQAHQTVLEISGARDWQRGIALALQNLGSVAVAEGDYTTAREALASSHEIRRDLGDDGGAAWAAAWRGRADRLDGRVEDARRWLTRARAGFLEVGDHLGLAFALDELGGLAHDEGDDGTALTYHLDALRDLDETGNLLELVGCLESLGGVAIARQLWETGVAIFAAATAWRRAHDAPPPLPLRNGYDRSLAQARSTLEPAAFERAWAEGEAIAIDRAIGLAFTLGS